jgi:hypothetical protein
MGQEQSGLRVFPFGRVRAQIVIAILNYARGLDPCKQRESRGHHANDPGDRDEWSGDPRIWTE